MEFTPLNQTTSQESQSVWILCGSQVKSFGNSGSKLARLQMHAAAKNWSALTSTLSFYTLTLATKSPRKQIKKIGEKCYCRLFRLMPTNYGIISATPLHPPLSSYRTRVSKYKARYAILT